MSNLMTSYTKDIDVIKISFAGPITETSLFPALNLEGVKHVVLHLGEISYINSGGVCLWSQWIREFGENHASSMLILDHMPYVLSRYIVAIGNFIPKNSQIKSFLAPYYCANCNVESNRLLRAGKEFSTSGLDQELLATEKTLQCEKCGQIMEIDPLIEHVINLAASLF